ncbi:MAG: MCE family protein [Gammaproteobacteria bacterium]|nr:MCE family protein [Gammaproteobacteria bacterium]MCP5424418.1 MCE family protein [Gammaproteobacteria bacterium]MCP5458412.1 MCE family protein [Gammaproteobacteria bacterium]
MESDVKYTVVGLFVVVLGAAILAVVAWLTSATDQRVYDYYRLYSIESVAGLNPNASVTYKGVSVGQVSAIRLDQQFPDWVEVILRIERGTPIRKETTATLVAQGITGLVYVELSGGGDSPPLLPSEDEPMPVIKSSPSLVAQVTSAFQDLTVALDKLLSDKNLASFSQTLANLSVISSTLAHHSDDLDQTMGNLEKTTAAIAKRADKLGQALDHAEKTLANLEQASATLKPLILRIGTTFDDANTMVNSVTETSEYLRVAFTDTLREIAQLAQRTAPDLSVLLEDLDRLALSLERFVKTLERNPRMLLLGNPGNPPGPGEK